jgi:hypothetical protein
MVKRLMPKPRAALDHSEEPERIYIFGVVFAHV